MALTQAVGSADRLTPLHLPRHQGLLEEDVVLRIVPALRGALIGRRTRDQAAQAQQADAAESEVAQAASQEGGTPIAATASAPAAPVTVALGQTMDQVKAILGKPMKTADLGPKTTYYYDGMKVVFKAGKVSDVE